MYNLIKKTGIFIQFFGKFFSNPFLNTLLDSQFSKAGFFHGSIELVNRSNNTSRSNGGRSEYLWMCRCGITSSIFYIFRLMKRKGFLERSELKFCLQSAYLLSNPSLSLCITRLSFNFQYLRFSIKLSSNFCGSFFCWF